MRVNVGVMKVKPMSRKEFRRRLAKIKRLRKRYIEKEFGIKVCLKGKKEM